MRKTWLFIALAGLLSGCASDSHTTEAKAEMVAEEMAEVTTRSDASGAEIIEMPEQRKVIKTGRMGIQVDRVEEAKRRVDSLVARYQGYYANEESNDGYRSGVTLTIRVPAGRFDAFTAALEAGKGKMLYKNISARDVSEEYLDIETRLDNKRRYLERYQEILGRATTIKEIMEMEQYIRRLEEEIESAEGRLRYLDNQTAYSTLELGLSTERIAESARDTFGKRVVRALSTGWNGLVSLLVGLLYLWPLLLIGMVIAGVIRWQVRRKKNTK